MWSSERPTMSFSIPKNSTFTRTLVIVSDWSRKPPVSTTSTPGGSIGFSLCALPPYRSPFQPNFFDMASILFHSRSDDLRNEESYLGRPFRLPLAQFDVQLFNQPVHLSPSVRISARLAHQPSS